MSGKVEISNITIRRLKIADICCELLSMPDFLGFTGTGGILGRSILFMSTIKPIHKALVKFFPCFLVGLPLVAVNKEKKVVGFAWLQTKKVRRRVTAAIAGIGV